MNTTALKGSFVTRWLALITISVPVIFQGLWQAAFRSGHNQEERVRIFMGYFGGLFSETFQITATSLIFCLVTIIVSPICARKTEGPFRSLNNTCLIAAVLLLMLNLFSLM